MLHQIKNLYMHKVLCLLKNISCKLHCLACTSSRKFQENMYAIKITTQPEKSNQK